MVKQAAYSSAIHQVINSSKLFIRLLNNCIDPLWICDIESVGTRLVLWICRKLPAFIRGLRSAGLIDVCEDDGSSASFSKSICCPAPDSTRSLQIISFGMR